MTCRVAWRGGVHRTPEWRRVGDLLPVSAVHALVRGFGLPRAELLHMGWSEALLSSSAPTLVPECAVEHLFGRLLLDRRYNHSGERWPDGSEYVYSLGAELIDERFL